MNIHSLLVSLGVTPKEFLTSAIGFIILVFLLRHFLLKPITDVIDKRQDDIKSTYDQLDADRAAMERTRREYEQRLADVENQAREKIQAAVKEAQELRASIIAEAQKQAETVVHNGQAELEREKSRIFAELRQEIADIAILAAGKVVGDSLDDARHRKLVDQFITSVGSTSVTSAASNGAASVKAGAGS